MGAVFPPSGPHPCQADDVTYTNSMVFEQTQYHATNRVPKPCVHKKKRRVSCYENTDILHHHSLPFPSPDMHADVCPPGATPFLPGVPVIVHYAPPNCAKSPAHLETNHDRLIAPRRLSRM